MGDEENIYLRRSERLNKSKRPARFNDFEIDEPIDKMPRIDSPENLDNTIRENPQNVIPTAPPTPDLLVQMSQLVNSMAERINNSMDSMESKIEDTRISLQNHMTNNIAAISTRMDDVQRNMESSLQNVNQRLESLENQSRNSSSSAPETRNAEPTILQSSSTVNGGFTPIVDDGLVRQLSKTLSNLNAHRKLIDLPKFSGEPEEWPQFIAQFRSTTEREQYSSIENNIRLGNALQGKARILVQSLLIHHSNVDAIIQRLECRFGLPQQLAESQLNAIRKIEAISEYNLPKLVPFADRVINLRNFLENAGCAEYLNSPSLLKDLTIKLPYRERIAWTHYSRDMNPPTVKEFSDWLIALADDIHRTMADEPPEKKRPNRVLHTDVVRSSHCICCKEMHDDSLGNCSKFKEMPYKHRLEIARSNGICFCCLEKGHILTTCPQRKKCDVLQCKRMHHILLHQYLRNELDPNAETFNPPSTSGTVMSCLTTNSVKVWFKIVPVKIYGPKGMAEIYALLDDGASVTMINRKVASEIGAVGSKLQLNLKWLDNDHKQMESEVTQLKISGNFPKAKTFDLYDVHIVDNMNLPHQTLNLDELRQKFVHIRGLPIQQFTNAVPSLLIGLDNSHLGRPKITPKCEDFGPIPILTKLGYVVYGSARDQGEENRSGQILLTSRTDGKDELHQMISEYFSTENFGVKILPPLEADDVVRANNILDRTTIKLQDRYQSGLIWKRDTVNFPISLPCAINRFRTIERKMSQNAEFADLYRATIEGYIKKGYAKKLSTVEIKSPKGPVWYLPHFGVTNPNKPNKFRLVFDGAATVQNVSLNSELLSGPDINQPLIKVLSQFRERPIGVCADIAEMFHQIVIRPEDRDSQRFVWRAFPDQPLEIMRMEVMIFGSASSPTTAQFVKNLNSRKFESQYPEASKAIRKNHYVDDYVHCFSSETEAIRVTNEIKNIHKFGGFELRNFISNSDLVSRELNKKTQSDTNDVNLDVGNGINSVDKILGLFWSFRDDQFTFQFKFHRIEKDILEQNRMPTKREFLSIIMSVFDPFGFLSNFMIQVKILFAKLWKVDMNWDDVLPDEFKNDWCDWIKQLPKLRSFHVPRCLNASLFESISIEWHTFVDASELAFAAVSYIRVTDSLGNINVSYVCGKTKSAPLKPLSIPRMELQAAVMGVRMQNSMSSCHTFPIKKFVMWSDSKTVIHWIKDKKRRYKQFVSNRIAEILETTKEDWWFWVPSKENVADDATKSNKGCQFEINSRWIEGPEWLRLGEWPVQPKDFCTEEVNEEVLLSARLLLINLNHLPFDVKHYSDISRLQRHVVWLMRFKKFIIAKVRKSEVPKGWIRPYELREAEAEICKSAQKDAFPEEFALLNEQKPIKKTSSLYKCMPYLDELGTMRVYGRVDNSPTLPVFSKRPIILPSRHHLTDIVIKSYHERFAHQLEELTMAEIRRKYYISNLRRIVRKVKKDCMQCKIENAVPVQPMMGQLPKERLTPYIRPFSHCGVDYFGPVSVSIGRRKEKRWIALFTCLTVRAVHVEISENLSSDSFIICLKNFVNLRGVPSTIHSDNGSNFVGAHTEIIKSQEFFENMKIQEECGKQGIHWKFNNPSDPAAGGCWERLVQSIKRVLKRIMKDVSPKLETLRCFLLEAANIVNSRPLTHIPLENFNEEPLTPNLFLLGCPNTVQTPGPTDEKLWCLRKQWRISNSLKNHFWSLWVRDFLPTLTRRSKWCEKVEPLKVGDVVLLCDENTSRHLWRKGIVEEVMMANDGQSRSAKVNVEGKLLRRPTSKLAILDIIKSPWQKDLPGGGCHQADLSKNN